jgi:hypothetical protein
MYIILASTASGTNGESLPNSSFFFFAPKISCFLNRCNAGVNHKGQLLDECDRGICDHAGEYLTHQHWSCCGHARHEPCLCPAVPAPPREKRVKKPPRHAARDLALLILGKDSCGFPHEGAKRELWLKAFLSHHDMSLALCDKFMEVAKDDPSREWDSTTIAELCPDAGSFKDATVQFLLSVSNFLKSTDAPVEPSTDEPEETFSGGMEGMQEALKQFVSQMGGSADKKTKSKYQFK